MASVISRLEIVPRRFIAPPRLHRSRHRRDARQHLRTHHSTTDAPPEMSTLRHPGYFFDCSRRRNAISVAHATTAE